MVHPPSSREIPDSFRLNKPQSTQKFSLNVSYEKFISYLIVELGQIGVVDELGEFFQYQSEFDIQTTANDANGENPEAKNSILPDS